MWCMSPSLWPLSGESQRKTVGNKLRALAAHSNNIADMVVFFTSSVVDPPATIYVGKDKEESKLKPSPFVITAKICQLDEDLIKVRNAIVSENA